MTRARRRARPGAPSCPIRAPAAGTTAAAARGARWAAWWWWASLVVLVVVVYGAAPRAAFVNWDDGVHVYENARVTAPDALRRSWSAACIPGFYPILFGTYRLEWLAASRQPWLFHLDNVILHAVDALLVGLLAAELGLGSLAAWFAATLWALHPAHVESVAWVSERKNVLYVLFWLGSLLVWLRWRRGDGRPAPLAYAVALLLFALSLLSKGAAVTLPAALVLLEWYRGGRLDRRFWLSLAPYVALGLVVGLHLTRLVPATLAVPPLVSRLAIACRAFWFYLATFVWPYPLVPVYAKWSLAPAGPAVLAALGLAALATVAAAVRARVPRVVLFGGGFFVVNLSVVLGIVWNSYMGHAFVADRYLYLPAVGLTIAAVAGMGELAPRMGLPPRGAALAGAAALAALAVATWRQVPVWHDSDALWTYTLAHNPDCVPCHENLGLVLLERGELDAAAAHYERARRLGIGSNGAVAFCVLRRSGPRNPATSNPQSPSVLATCERSAGATGTSNSLYFEHEPSHKLPTLPARADRLPLRKPVERSYAAGRGGSVTTKCLSNMLETT